MKVFTVSDIHIDFKVNKDWLDNIQVMNIKMALLFWLVIFLKI